MTSERNSNLYVVQMVGDHNCSVCRKRGGICHELKVVLNALLLCLWGARNFDVLLVYPRGSTYSR